MLASAKDEVDARKKHMKIVHVETGRHFYGGAQQVIWLQQGLVERGAECLLVCPPGSAISAKAKELGLEFTELRCGGDHDLIFALRLRALLQSRKPDLVHCHGRRGADFLGGLAAGMAGVPAVLSRRVDNPESATMAKLRYRGFQSVIAISSHIANLLEQNGLDPAIVEVIRDAVDVDGMDPAPARSLLQQHFDIAPDAIAIAVVAQLIARKGHRFLLDVLPGLLSDHAGIKVVFFGQGEKEADLRALAKKLGLSAAVHFAGFRDDLDSYLGAFDLLVHPAEREGMGVAMLKAAAAGLPVVAFDIAGAKEAVVHGVTGVLVEPGNLAGLQRAIEVLIEDREIRHELGQAGRRRMRDEFSVAAMVESHLELYERILNG